MTRLSYHPQSTWLFCACLVIALGTVQCQQHVVHLAKVASSGNHLQPLPKVVQLPNQSEVSANQSDPEEVQFPPLSRWKLYGISRRKALAELPVKVQGVRIEESSGDKRRNEGSSWLKHGVIKSGRAGSPSAMILKRFYSPKGHEMIQVEPAAVKQEAPDLEVKMINTNEVRRVLSGANTEQVEQPIVPDHNESEPTVLETIPIRDYSKEIGKKPAFCRRCYRFWKGISAARVGVVGDDDVIYEYCCTVGSHKSQAALKLSSLNE
ncbi:hypothetical protein AAVH_04533 [Aphelenchoides avenae]|nr:hypothetical protein AAVH_04533 [Aphelenchus avenae]